MFFWNDKWYDKYHEITDQERNGDLLGYYIGCNETTKNMLKKHDKIVILLSKRHLWITWRHLLFKVQYRV